MFPRMRQINLPLYLGTLLCTAFVLLAIFGPQLAPHDPMQRTSALADGERVHVAPFRPFEVEDFVLGSDELGRDVLSRILWGIRPTLVVCLVVAVARIVVGVGLGLAAGWFRGAVERAVDGLISLSLAFPVLLFAMVAIFYIGINRGLGAFVVALTLVGWIEVASLVKAQTLTVVQSPFVESARALGLHSGRLLLRHVLPQLYPVLPVLFSFELSAVLLLVTELGFLGIFIGGGFLYRPQDGVTALASGYPELGQQIARFWTKFYRVPWEFLIVGLVIFLQVAGFNLLGEGLRRELDVTRPQRNWRRRLQLPDVLVDRASQVPRRIWLALGGAAGMFVLGAVLSTRAGLLPTTQPEPSRAASVVSTEPVSKEQLVAVDLQALITQPDVLPSSFSDARGLQRLPDLLRNVPQPANWVSLNLQFGTSNTISVLLYATLAERDQAVQVLLETVASQPGLPPDLAVSSPDSAPVVGEQSYILRYGVSQAHPVTPEQIVFVRCGAVVYLRLREVAGAGMPTLARRTDGGRMERETPAQAPLYSLARALDSRLAPLVCRPQ